MRHKTVEPLVTSASRNEQRGPIKVGDYVQWTSNGIDQFKPVRKITQTEGNHVWVHGSQTGIPLSEVTSAEPPAPIPVAKLATPAKSGPSDNESDGNEIRVLVTPQGRLQISADLDVNDLGKLTQMLEQYEQILNLLPHRRCSEPLQHD